VNEEMKHKLTPGDVYKDVRVLGGDYGSTFVILSKISDLYWSYMFIDKAGFVFGWTDGNLAPFWKKL
jgi:ATP-dependent helicase/DNAse subunit B